VTRRLAPLGCLVALLALSLWLRADALGGGLWIDEAISWGIAGHPITEIPVVLRQDGSPPLYYVLLHVWMELFGDGEQALRSLSLVAALLTVPAALWAGTVAAGRRAGWLTAVLAALNPFLTIYAQEARMYSLVALLSVLACGSFVRGVVDGVRRHQALLAVELAALLYTHAWAIFFLFGLAVAATIHLRARWRDALLPFVAAAVLFLPWLPTLLDQARETGAPWSKTPSLAALLGGVPGALDGGGGAAVVIAVGAIGFLRLRPEGRAARVALLLGVAAAVALTVAWAHSHVSPSWANRYLAIVVGPVIVVGAAGLSRAGRLGLVTAGAVSVFWLGFSVDADRSNVRAVAAAARVQSESVVVSTQPEQVPLLAYYLERLPKFATPLGPVAEPRVMDWRDALARLRRVDAGGLARVVDRMQPGQTLGLVLPLPAERGWDAPWQREVRRVSDAWLAAAVAEPRLRPVDVVRAPRAERSRTDIELRFFQRV
jgi:mannosyltransferase